MATDAGSDVALVLPGVLNDISDRLEALLAAARRLVQESLEDFVNKKIGCLWGAVECYRNAFERIEVTSKDSIERVIRKHFRNEDVRDAFESLSQTEQAWDSFLAGLDKSMRASEKSPPVVVTVGDTGPVDTPLVNVRSKESVTLQRYTAQGGKSVLAILLRHFA